MPIPPDMIGPSTIAISQGFSAFTTFLPKLTDIRRKDPSQDMEFVADVRLGEVAATTLVMGFGTIVSSLTGSQYPVMVSAVVCFILVCIYEWALQGRRFSPKIPEGTEGKLIING